MAAVPGDVVRVGMFGNLLIIAGVTLIAVTAAPSLGVAAVSLARDVGNNCDPACLLGGLSALFGAAAIPTAASGGWGGPREASTSGASDAPPEATPYWELGPTDLEWWYQEWLLMWETGGVGDVGHSNKPSVGGDLGG